MATVKSVAIFFFLPHPNDLMSGLGSIVMALFQFRIETPLISYHQLFGLTLRLRSGLKALSKASSGKVTVVRQAHRTTKLEMELYLLPGKIKYCRLERQVNTKRGFIMSAFQIRQVGYIVFLIFIFLNLAEARDLSTLQSAVTYAREDMEKAKAKYEDNERAVTQQKRIVDERKKQLADESKRLDKAQQDTILSEKQYLEAQKKYQKAQSTLDQAWNKK